MPYKNRVDKQAFDIRRRKAAGLIIDGWFATRSCVDCGNKDRRVLEPDHIRGEKRFTIGRTGRNFSIPILLVELDKCECRCANCHKIRHYEEKRRSTPNF